MKNPIKSFYQRVLCFIIYPLYHFFYELFNKDYILLTASVYPMFKNWGDDVSEQIVKLINPKNKVIINRYSWNIRKKENYLCIGSIVSWMTTPKSIIWGSGVVYPNQKISAKPLKVLAVRGPLTRKYLLGQGIDCPEIFGDPAMLFPMYYTPKTNKIYKIGIIPHFRDKRNVLLDRFRNDENVNIIDVQNVRNWRTFIDEINSCDCICTSSLHGLIISDAYSIPCLWVQFEGGERKNFAFEDYLASVQKYSVKPYILTRMTSKQQLIEQCGKWQKPIIDLEKLLLVCPFK